MVSSQQVLAIVDMEGQTAMPGKGVPGEGVRKIGKYKMKCFVNMMIGLIALKIFLTADNPKSKMWS